MWLDIEDRRHYFNIIGSTSRPFFVGMCVLQVVILLVVILVKRFEYIIPYRVLCSVNNLLYYVSMWIGDVQHEASSCGRYGRKLRSALVMGSVLFVVSEVMLFTGFSWVFFDRIYNVGNDLCYMPVMLETFNAWRWPYVGTIALVTSGYFANHAYYNLRIGNLTQYSLFGTGTIVLAVLFLAIQCLEYNSLELTMADSVYGSIFYVLTGFHGMHVTVGIFMLSSQLSVLLDDSDEDEYRIWQMYWILNVLFSRMPETLFILSQEHEISESGDTEENVMRFLAMSHAVDHAEEEAETESAYMIDQALISISNRQRHIGLGMALIYWHFVDIAWIFSFSNVYVYNNYNVQQLEFWEDIVYRKWR